MIDEPREASDVPLGATDDATAEEAQQGSSQSPVPVSDALSENSPGSEESATQSADSSIPAAVDVAESPDLVQSVPAEKQQDDDSALQAGVADSDDSAPGGEPAGSPVDDVPPAETAEQPPAPGEEDAPESSAQEESGESATPVAVQPGDDQTIGDMQAADTAADTKTEEAAEEVEEEVEDKRDWYILKVQSNREDSIREGLLRRIAMEGLEDSFGDIIVPTEMVSEFKGGKKRVVKRKLYPGYIVVNMEINDDTWFLVRDTPGVGDFTGSGGKPSPMLPHEVSRILVMESDETKDKGPKPKISFRTGDQVKINEGTFENFEGNVDGIDEANGRVTVMINIFGRSTPVELEYWQVESV